MLGIAIGFIIQDYAGLLDASLGSDNSSSPESGEEVANPESESTKKSEKSSSLSFPPNQIG